MASSHSHSDEKCRMLDNITVVGYLGRQMSCLMPFICICISFAVHFSLISTTFAALACCTLLLPCYCLNTTTPTIGSVTGALVFVILAIGFFWFCKSQSKNLSNRNFETGSSDPSALVEWEREAGQSSSYDTGLDSSTRLEFKQRLTIALGPAKGLCHLHSLKPPLVHGNYQTVNVLVDGNFIGKVADAEVFRILEKIEEEEDPSCPSTVDVLQDVKIDFF
ncbi:hypothetical protein SLEP1_g40242 [Rubroshorea leprosula]|uniref:non-specific serine/threonine protein kinase n=1 Tax=Rubroshorea leprosula TaxID=152421 RepID=A0AAV5L371_9ROSI|nr:hypothetical protein SLEP1_g40242 [Rubroshorea leprosula]